MEAEARESQYSVYARCAAAILLLAVMIAALSWLWPAAAWAILAGAVIAVLAIAAEIAYVIFSLEAGYGPEPNRSSGFSWKHRHLRPSNTVSHGAH